MQFILGAFADIFQPVSFAFLFIGSALGLLVGVLPGLSSPMALAILIPITFGMEPFSAFMILIGIYVGTKTGGAFSAILIRTPGTPAAAATAMEGFPMAQRGEAGRALALSIGASFCGGTASWLVAVPLVGVIGIYAVRISSADLAMIGLLALAAVSSLSGRDLLKGLMASCLGLIISTIGLDELTGMPRLTLGYYQLLGGIPFLAAIVGLFAVATVLVDISQDAASAKPPSKDGSFRMGGLLRDLWNMRKQLAVGTTIGSLLGIVPGVGSDTAGWLSYAYVKRQIEKGFLKSDRKMGEGVPQGLAAPEAANNAVTGGATIPMLTLGIPGDGSTAIMLGALMLFGLQPGPLFFRESPEMAYGILVALGVANLTTLIAAFLLIRPFTAVLRIDRAVLLGSVLILALAGSFASTNNSFEMVVALVFGVLGYFMYRFNFSIPALALGLILGPVIESNFRRALMISRGDATVFLTSPLSLLSIVVLTAIAGKFLYDFASRSKHRTEAKPGRKSGP
tara:strand:- start:1199 stop:2731 length:1533 start_codon:yes stop_codon:yes gene_type:complete